MGIADLFSRNDLNANKIKIIGAAAALLVAGVIIFSSISFGGGEVVMRDPAREFINQVHATFPYEGFLQVNLQPSEDSKSVLVTGSVKNAAELAQLKSLFEKADPQFPHTIDVKVGSK